MSKMSAAHLDEQENPTWGNKTSYKNPVFQKRHYEFLADVFIKIKKEYKKQQIETNEFEFGPSDCIGRLCSEFERISPKNRDGKPIFDRQKFLDRINK